MKKKILIIIIFATLLGIGIIVNYQKTKTAKTYNDNKTTYQSSSKIVCQIKGEVVRPGVYYLNAGDHMQDLVLLAGGFTKSADINSINLVSVLEDNKCYVVAKDNNEETINEKYNLINVNTATKEELMTLDGIGSSKADAIIKYRQENGNFSSIDDLKNVSGITENIINKNIDKICVK